MTVVVAIVVTASSAAATVLTTFSWKEPGRVFPGARTTVRVIQSVEVDVDVVVDVVSLQLSPVA